MEAPTIGAPAPTTGGVGMTEIFSMPAAPTSIAPVTEGPVNAKAFQFGSEWQTLAKAAPEKQVPDTEAVVKWFFDPAEWETVVSAPKETPVVVEPRQEKEQDIEKLSATALQDDAVDLAAVREAIIAFQNQTNSVEQLPEASEVAIQNDAAQETIALIESVGIAPNRAEVVVQEVISQAIATEGIETYLADPQEAFATLQATIAKVVQQKNNSQLVTQTGEAVVVDATIQALPFAIQKEAVSSVLAESIGETDGTVTVEDITTKKAATHEVSDQLVGKQEGTLQAEKSGGVGGCIVAVVDVPVQKRRVSAFTMMAEKIMKKEKEEPSGRAVGPQLAEAVQKTGSLISGLIHKMTTKTEDGSWNNVVQKIRQIRTIGAAADIETVVTSEKPVDVQDEPIQYPRATPYQVDIVLDA